MESALRPRDIQARIRAGATPEAVAQAAQTTVDRIMTFAMPVLAERAHIADRAQRASVRRKAGDGPAKVLGEAVRERLRGRNLDPDSVEWDAWRRDDGRWTLVADYRSGEQPHRAEFTFDAPGRYVVAEDEEARWLVGEQSAHRGPQPRTGHAPARRLSAVGGEDELPLGADAIDMVSDSDTDEPTLDLTGARESVARRTDEGATGDADWIATQASARPLAPPVEVPAPELPDASESPGSAEGPDSPEAGGAAGPDVARAQEPAAAEEPAEPAQKRTSRKGRRASVPSWDEIMFGGGRSD